MFYSVKRVAHTFRVVNLTPQRSQLWFRVASRVSAGMTPGRRSISTKPPVRLYVTSKHSSTLNTLRRDRIIAGDQDIFDLTGKTALRIYVGSKTERNNYAGLAYSVSEKRIPHWQRFPPNSKGFLYYHDPPELPELAGSIRFRLCKSPQDFEKGHDLLLPSTRPWEINLFRLVKNNSMAALASLLKSESLVDEALMEDVAALDAPRYTYRSQFLYSLADPFDIDLSSSMCQFTVLSRKRAVTLQYLRLSLGNNGYDHELQRSLHVRPLTGVIRVQLELSQEPEHKDLGPYVLVARVLEIVKPIARKPDVHEDVEIPIPKPGSLLCGIRHGKKQVLYMELRRLPNREEIWPFMKEAFNLS